MLLNLDLHVHTVRSPDGCSTISDIANVARSRGLHGIAVADHDLIMFEGESVRLSGELGLLVIPAVELTTDVGHLLVLNPKRDLVGFALREAAQAASKDGSPIIIPHPMDPFSHGIGENQTLSILCYSPLIEVLNASTLSRYNKKASTLASSNSLPVVGGSDAHIAEAVGDAYTVVDTPCPDLNSVLAAIANGQTRPAGGRTSINTSLKTVYARLKKYINRR